MYLSLIALLLPGEVGTMIATPFKKFNLPDDVVPGDSGLQKSP
jgi:hypothetical protein